jgi:uncharacterized protein (TIGR02246 family)
MPPNPDLDGAPNARLGDLLTAVNRFYAAFNGRDLAGMRAVWAADGVLYNPIGGIARGWDAIAAIYQRLFAGPVTIHVTFYDYVGGGVGDSAWVAGRERGTARRGARSLPLAIRTSRLFHRSDGQWRQIHHHGSLDDPQQLAAYQQLVRGDGA